MNVQGCRWDCFPLGPLTCKNAANYGYEGAGATYSVLSGSLGHRWDRVTFQVPMPAGLFTEYDGDELEPSYRALSESIGALRLWLRRARAGVQANSGSTVETKFSVPITQCSCGYDFYWFLWYMMSVLVAQRVKNLPAVQEAQVRSLGWENLLEERMATHSSILAWRIP